MARRPANWGDYDAAVRMREVIVKMAAEAIEKLRPQTKSATVVNVDRAGGKALLVMETDTDPVNINIPWNGGPWDEGDLVEVQTSLGAMKVTKVIYSPRMPAGVYVQPGLVSPIETNIDGIGTVQRELILSQYPLTNTPYFLGRWVLNDSAFIINGAAATVTDDSARFVVYIAGQIEFDFLYYLHTDTGGWVCASAVWFRDPIYGPEWTLEYRTGLDDSGRRYIELRARLTVAGSPFWNLPWPVNLRVHGNVYKDSTFPPAITSGAVGPAAPVNFQMSGDTGAQGSSTGWTLTGTGGNSVTALSWRVKNGRVTGQLTLQFGATVVVPVDGNIGNQVFGNVPTWLFPKIPAQISTLSTGPLALGYVGALDGRIVISAVPPGATINASTVLIVGFSFDL